MNLLLGITALAATLLVWSITDIGDPVIFAGGVVSGLLLAARLRQSEVEELKKQARAYRLRAASLYDLCRRLEQINQSRPDSPGLPLFDQAQLESIRSRRIAS